MRNILQFKQSNESQIATRLCAVMENALNRENHPSSQFSEEEVTQITPLSKSNASTVSQVNGSKKWYFVSFILFLLLIFLLIILSSCNFSSKEKAETSLIQSSEKSLKDVDRSSKEAPPLMTQLEMTDLSVGKGAVAKENKKITIQYLGTFEDGKIFDSSYERGKALTFVMGSHEVIPGLEDGVKEMKVGGKRKLVIPSTLAYGSRGVGDIIPPNSTLIFHIELVEVR